jgi:ABC-type iron transport system FetAB permease component
MKTTRAIQIATDIIKWATMVFINGVLWGLILRGFSPVDKL